MERVQKIIAHAGFCSRRKAEEMIEQGLVTVNGKQAKLGDTATNDDEIKVSGVLVKKEKSVYYMLHKPKGFISTASDPWGRSNVTNLVHDDKRLFPVGRLDKDTTGLLLLTNDGDWANRIMHPRYEVSKTYEATLDKEISHQDVDAMNEGIILDRKKIDVQARKISKRKIEITVHTGMNKEIKRIMKKFGFWVRELQRTQIGTIKLNVREGKFRKLTQPEIAQFHQE